MDVEANRRAVKYDRREQVARVLWACAQPLFRLSPRPIWGVRNRLLRAFGARIGSNVHIHPTVRITMPWNLDIGDHAAVGDRAILYALGRITIGHRASVSQHAHLCAGSHDWRRIDRPLTKEPIVIGDDAWICADAFVGPGVSVGAESIVGARAVIVRNVPPRVIVAGNPARVVRRLGGPQDETTAGEAPDR